MVDTNGLDYYEVGGSVRDELLDREPHDQDYVVVGHTADEMRERGFTPVEAQSFPVFLDDDGDEWALARKERKTGDGYKGFETFTDDVSLKEDLERRDLTINAMAKDPETGDLIDPFGGQDDLEAGLLRPVSDAFGDDPVRVLRAVRYRQRFGFRMTGELRQACRSVAHELNHVPNERIGTELMKTFRQAETMGSFLPTLEDVGALQYISPDLAALRHVSAGPLKYHGEGDALAHTQLVMNEVFDAVGNDEILLTMAMLHDIGKVVTGFYKDGDHHHGHDKEGVDLAAHICRHQLKLSNEHIQAAKDACRHHMRFHDIPDMRESTLLKMVKSLVRGKGASVDQLRDLAMADTLGRVTTEENLSDAVTTGLKSKQHTIPAKDIIESVGAEEALADRDGGVDDYDGEAIGDMILQEQIRRLRERRPDVAVLSDDVDIDSR